MCNYKTLLSFSILLLLISTKTFSQIDTVTYTPDVERLSRYRLSLGYVTLLSENSSFEFRQFFFNANYRYSGFRKAFSSSFEIKFALEPGLNGLFIAERKSGSIMDFDLFFVPYAKFGPEARMDQNLLLGVSLGLSFPFNENGIFIAPFAGVNSYYLLDIGNNLHLEFETGFHTTYSPGDLPYFVYITVGISLI